MCATDVGTGADGKCAGAGDEVRPDADSGNIGEAADATLPVLLAELSIGAWHSLRLPKPCANCLRGNSAGLAYAETGTGAVGANGGAIGGAGSDGPTGDAVADGAEGVGVAALGTSSSCVWPSNASHTRWTSSDNFLLSLMNWSSRSPVACSKDSTRASSGCTLELKL